MTTLPPFLSQKIIFNTHAPNTLLIFDEIQECPEALNSLKYFCEDAPEYYVASAGSLLGLQLSKGFPDDIKDRAGALFVKKQKGIFDKIIIEVLSELAETYHNPDREKLLEEYKNRSIVVGKKITVIKNGNEEPAKALSIADNYSLVIEKEHGEIEEISTGDISIKL